MSLPRPPPFSTSTQAAAAATGKVCAGVSPAAVVAAIAAPVAAVACCCCYWLCCCPVAVYRFALPLVNFLQRLGESNTATTGSKINWKLISCFDYRLCRTFYDLEYDTFVSSQTLSRCPVAVPLSLSGGSLSCWPVGLLFPRGCVHFLTKLARQWHELKRNETSCERSWS